MNVPPPRSRGGNAVRRVGETLAAVRAYVEAGGRLPPRTTSPLYRALVLVRRAAERGTIPLATFDQFSAIPGWSWRYWMIEGDLRALRLALFLHDRYVTTGRVGLPRGKPTPGLGRRDIEAVRRRYVRHRLPPKLAALFERLPGWTWAPLSGRLHQDVCAARLVETVPILNSPRRCESLASAVLPRLEQLLLTGQRLDAISDTHLLDDGRSVADAVSVLRTAARDGLLARTTLAAFERLPGWSWHLPEVPLAARVRPSEANAPAVPRVRAASPELARVHPSAVAEPGTVGSSTTRGVE